MTNPDTLPILPNKLIQPDTYKPLDSKNEIMLKLMLRRFQMYKYFNSKSVEKRVRYQITQYFYIEP